MGIPRNMTLCHLMGVLPQEVVGRVKNVDNTKESKEGEVDFTIKHPLILISNNLWVQPPRNTSNTLLCKSLHIGEPHSNLLYSLDNTSRPTALF